MSEKTTGHLWRLVEEWMDYLPYRPSQSQLADRIDVSRSTISEWKYATSMPKPAALERLANEMKVPYERLLDAALRDSGYRPPEQEGRRSG